MSGFANQIIGGLSKLIRPAIQSPNYKPSTAGWTVNADGSAEFNDATFRGTVVINSGGTALLVYDGAPAAGNLILSISAFAGNDAFGNNYPGGICVTNANGTAGNAGYTARWNPTDPLAGVQPLSLGFLNNLQTGLVSQLEMFLQTNNQDLLLTSGPANQVRIFSSDFSLGNGPRGKYYAEQNYTTGQTIPNGFAVTNLVLTSTGTLNSDYGSKWSYLSYSVWTCPVTGWYDFNAFIEYSTVPSELTRNDVRLQFSTDGGTTWNNAGYTSSPANTASFAAPMIPLTAGTLARFQLLHDGTTSGVLRSATSFVSIGRRL